MTIVSTSKSALITGAWVFILALTSACTDTFNQQPVTTRNSPLTHGNVQLNLEVGKTTQTKVLEVFGAPNITTTDGSGQEVWSYQRAATASQATQGSKFWTVILAGSSSSAAGFQQTSRMITLIIKFDEDGVVSDFRSRSSEF